MLEGRKGEREGGREGRREAVCVLSFSVLRAIAVCVCRALRDPNTDVFGRTAIDMAADYMKVNPRSRHGQDVLRALGEAGGRAGVSMRRRAALRSREQAELLRDHEGDAEEASGGDE